VEQSNSPILNTKHTQHAVLEIRNSATCLVQNGLSLTTMPLMAARTSAPAVGAAQLTPKINFGVYDPNGQYQQESGIAIEHVVISWSTYQSGYLLRQLALVQARRRWPFVTIEPWCDRTITSLPSELLGDVTKGKYDHTIQQLGGEIAAFRGLICLRWGHAMENLTGRYPWASHNAALYQKAYRHFVSTCRLSANNIAYVWSPAGDRDLARYWPGEQYVDCVGLSVLEFAGSDHGYYHQTTRSFHDQMTEKYTRVTRYKKPVVITECGVTGSEEYQLSWLSGALQDLGHYPLLKALIYFNAEEVAGVSGETAHAS
jgi:beta-mannanase